MVATVVRPSGDAARMGKGGGLATPSSRKRANHSSSRHVSRKEARNFTIAAPVR